MNDKVKYKRRNDLEFSSPRELESLFIEIENPDKNLIVGGLYKHPNCSNIELILHLQKMLQLIQFEKKHLILMGDFNINLLDYNEKETVSDFINFLFENSMQPHIF